jgi:membrane-associated phospholipid phosphatase
VNVKAARTLGNLAGSATLAWRAVTQIHLQSHSSGQLLLRLKADQKRIWRCPATTPALRVLGVTATLIALDPLVTPCVQQKAYQDMPAVRVLNRILSGGNMALLIDAVPLFFFVAGLLWRMDYAWRTGLLAAEAAADAEVIAITMKHLDGRRRPTEVGADGDFTRTWFRTKNRAWDGSGCFPSGHTAAAFAVATVFAERYGRYRRLAYLLAGIIGASRISTRAHYPSDVFFGAAAGYSISHFVVLQRDPATRELSA